MTRVFAKLAIKYGHRFTSVFTDDAMLIASQHEWAEGLGDMSEAEINHALEAAIDAYPSWPPTLGEFKALCRAAGQNNWESQSHLMLKDRTAKAITKEERVAMLDQHLPDLRKALKGQLNA